MPASTWLSTSSWLNLIAAKLSASSAHSGLASTGGAVYSVGAYSGHAIEKATWRKAHSVSLSAAASILRAKVDGCVSHSARQLEDRRSTPVRKSCRKGERGGPCHPGQGISSLRPCTQSAHAARSADRVVPPRDFFRSCCLRQSQPSNQASHVGGQGMRGGCGPRSVLQKCSRHPIHAFLSMLEGESSSGSRTLRATVCVAFSFFLDML